MENQDKPEVEAGIGIVSGGTLKAIWRFPVRINHDHVNSEKDTVR